MKTIATALAALLLLATPAAAQNSFSLEKLSEGVYAAIARAGGQATTNALIVEGEEYAIAAGAHFTREAISDLVTAAASVTSKPIRYFVLAHHHRGYSHIDFDFPPGKDVLMGWQTWQALDGEVREVAFPALFFGEGLTLKLGKRTVILTNIGGGHTDGDMLLFLPDEEILFASDLFYVRSVGYMGEGHMQEWILALEFMQQLEAKKIVPGYGPVSGTEELAEFKTYFKAFLTEVLKHIEQGDSLDKTLRTLSLPKYSDYDGYDRFLRPNIERAYRELKQDFTD